jgi:proteasome lid subunit RPN8/RPN11
MAVPRRVEVEELPPVAIPGRILNELCAHALETFPEECCGLVVGDARERFRRSIRCRNDMTRLHAEDSDAHPRDGKAAFWMNAQDQLGAEEQARLAGERVTAVYHSHVGAGVYLSELDLQYAEDSLFPYPEADHIVIGVHERRVTGVGLFQREARRAPFRGRPVAATGP